MINDIHVTTTRLCNWFSSFFFSNCQKILKCNQSWVLCLLFLLCSCNPINHFVAWWLCLTKLTIAPKYNVYSSPKKYFYEISGVKKNQISSFCFLNTSSNSWNIICIIFFLLYQHLSLIQFYLYQCKKCLFLKLLELDD